MRVYSRVVSEGAIVVDVGVNVATHTLFSVRLCGASSRVAAFESTRYASDRLWRKVQLNADAAPRICCQQVMVEATNGSAIEAVYSRSRLVKSFDDDPHAEHRGRPMTTAGATAETLGGAFAGLTEKRVDFVKFHVDGRDAKVLAGAWQTFSRDRPSTLMKLVPFFLRDNMDKFVSMFQFSRGLKYSLTDISSGNMLSEDVIEVVRMVKESGELTVVGRTL